MLWEKFKTINNKSCLTAISLMAKVQFLVQNYLAMVTKEYCQEIYMVGSAKNYF